MLSVCAAAARFYGARPTLHVQAMQCAQHVASTIFVHGQKNIELVHAFLILSLYPPLAQSRQDDRSWIYLGFAIRSVEAVLIALMISLLTILKHSFGSQS